MNKKLLLKSQLTAFVEWLLYNGLTPLTPKGIYEVLRFDGGTRQMPIITRNKSKTFLSCNVEAEAFIRKFIISIK